MIKASDNTQIAQVVLRVQQGEEQAKAELISATQNRLFKFCLLLGHNRELAEDLCQETYIKAFQNIQKLKNPETFLGWMYQIAKNLFIDYKRSAFSQNTVSEDLLKDLSYETDEDLILSIQKVLSQFEPEDRLLLLLIELEGYSYKEAGEITGISEDAVRSKLHRLRVLFIKKLNSSETN